MTVVGLCCALAVGGCATRRTTAATGEKRNACETISAYNRLPAPAPDDVGALKNYAHDFESILDHVTFKFEFRNSANKLQTAPVEVRNDFAVMQQSMRRFRAAVDAADSSIDKLRAAQDALAADTGFTAADQRLQGFLAQGCKRK